MMKRIISCILAFAMMLSMSAVWAADSAESSVNVFYNPETHEITVSGIFPDDYGKIAVLISKYNEENLNSYDDLTEENIAANLLQMATWNGTEPLVLKVSDDVEIGNYIAFCSVQGVGNIPGKVFYITDVNEQNTALATFKNATSLTVADAINTYCVEKPIISLPLDDAIYVANPSDVHQIFVNCIAEEETLTLEKIATCFDMALALVDFNVSSDKAAALDNYSDLLGIIESEDVAAYEATAAELVLSQAEATDGKILSKADFVKAFNKAVAVSAINSSTRETIKNNLLKYEDIIGIDVEEGYEKAVENKLNALMAFGSFKTPEEIKSAFDTAVAQNLKPTNQGTSSGSGSSSSGDNKPSVGGGSSFGGGSSGNGQTTVARPTGNDTEKVPMETETTFSDITAYTWAQDAINHLNKKGVLQGVGNGKFEPARSIKREEIAKIMVEAFDIAEKGGEKEFSDVSKDAWHYKYVNIAYQNGIINGVSDNAFGTGSDVTREQAVAMIYRYLKSTGYEFETDGEEFSDMNDCSEYAKEAVQALKNSGLISGNGDNTFCPKDSLTRAQAAVMIYNIISEMEAK